MYPDNMVQVNVRMYLYRWNEHTDDDPGNAHYQASSCETFPNADISQCLHLQAALARAAGFSITVPRLFVAQPLAKL